MGAKVSKQKGKNRKVSKNTLTPNRRKLGMPYNIGKKLPFEI